MDAGTRHGVCVNCAHGTVSTAYNAAACTTCPNGQYAVATEVECSDCEIGKYHETTGEACKLCESGRFAEGMAATSCVHCPSGKSGTNGDNVQQAGRSTEGTACYDCLVGKYTDVAAQAECKSCIAGKAGIIAGSQVAEASACRACDAGEFQPAAGQTLCSRCPAGKHQASTAQPRCITCSKACPAGQLSVGCRGEGLTEDDSVCFGGCSKGFRKEILSSLSWYCDSETEITAFRLENSSTYCKPLQAVKCEPCVAGAYNDVDNGDTCTPCPAGKYSGATATQCTSCLAGRYTTNANSASCPWCPSGRFQPHSGSSSCLECATCASGAAQTGCWRAAGGYCTPCAPGNFINTTKVCTPCPAGKYQSDSDQFMCESCATGTFQPAEGRVFCTNCGVGRFRSAGRDPTSCQACPEGKYTDTGAHSCRSCEGGKVAASPASPRCESCAAGKYSKTGLACSMCAAGAWSKPGAAECLRCPAGQYQPEMGHGSCIECGGGRFSSGIVDSHMCATCKLGQYQTEPGKTFCNDVKDTEYVRTASSLNVLTGQMELVQTTVTCPKPGLVKEFSCKNGIRSFDQPGYWHDGLEPHTRWLTTAPGHPIQQVSYRTRPMYIVNSSTQFYKCPFSDSCLVNRTDGSVECRVGSHGVLCAQCVDGFQRETLSGECAPCPKFAVVDLLLPWIVLAIVAMSGRYLYVRYWKPFWAWGSIFILPGLSKLKVSMFLYWLRIAF